MTSQEAFDIVLKNLREQGVASYRNGSCRFRGCDGGKCAVGWLIPDDEYSPEMDAYWEVVETRERVAKNLGLDVELLVDMQLAHDRFMPRCKGSSLQAWETAMERIAAENKLEYKAP